MTTLNTFKMQEAAKVAREERKALGLPSTRNPIERAKDKPDSLRCAITAKCYECVGMDGDSNYRVTIRTCTSYSCPLHVVRPYQKLKE
jgi:hypothetical protein